MTGIHLILPPTSRSAILFLVRYERNRAKVASLVHPSFERVWKVESWDSEGEGGRLLLAALTPRRTWVKSWRDRANAEFADGMPLAMSCEWRWVMVPGIRPFLRLVGWVFIVEGRMIRSEGEEVEWVRVGDEKVVVSVDNIPAPDGKGPKQWGSTKFDFSAKTYPFFD